MLYISLFICGFIEDFITLIYYKLAQKNRNILCAFTSMLRTFIWAFVLSGLINNLNNIIHLVFIYAVGGAVGSYYSLKIEPTIDRKILKLQRKGRKKKWGWLLGVNKK